MMGVSTNTLLTWLIFCLAHVGETAYPSSSTSEPSTLSEQTSTPTIQPSLSSKTPPDPTTQASLPPATVPLFEDELEESSAAAQTTTVQPPSTQPNLINVDVTVLTSAQTSRNPDAYFPSSTPSPDQMTATQTRTTVHPTSPPLNIFSTSPSFESRSTRAYNSTSGPDTAPVTQNEPTDVRSTASGSNISSSSTPEQTSTPTIQPSLSSKTPPDPTTQASLPPATVPLFEDELEESSAAAQTTTVQPPSTQPNLINVDVTVLTSAQTSRNPDAYFPSSTPSPDQMTATQTRTTVHPTSPPLNIFSTSPSFESRSTRAYNSTSGPDTAPVTQNEPTDVRSTASGSNISSSSTPEQTSTPTIQPSLSSKTPPDPTTQASLPPATVPLFEDELEESSAAAQTTTVQPPSTQPNLINVDVTVLTSAQTSRNPDAYFPSSTPSPDQMTATQTRTTVHPTSPPLNIFSTSPSFESRSTRAYNSTSGPDTAPVTQNEPTDVRPSASGSNISSSSTPEQTSTPTIQPSLSSKTLPDPTTQASLPPATVPLFEDELEESSAAAQTTTVQPPSTQPNLINVDVTVLTSAQTSRNPDAYFPSSTPSPDQMTATQTRTTVHPTSPPLNIFSTSPSFESRSTRAYNSTSGPDTAPVTQNEPTDVRSTASGSNISSSSTPEQTSTPTIQPSLSSKTPPDPTTQASLPPATVPLFEDELEESSAAAQTTTVQPPSTQPNLINVDVTVLTSAQTSRNPDAYFPSSTPSPDQMTATQTRTTVHPTSPPLNIFSTSPSFESRSTRAYNSTSGPDTAPVTQNEPTDVRSTASGSNISSSSTPEQTSTPTIQPSLSSKTPPDPTTQASLPPATVPLFEDELEESSAAAQTTTVQPPSTQPNLINVDVTVLTSAQTSRNPDAYFPSSTPSPDQMTATQTRTTVHPTSPPLNIFSTSPSFESRSTRAYNSTSGPDTAPVTQNEPTDVRSTASGSNISSSSTPEQTSTPTIQPSLSSKTPPDPTTQASLPPATVPLFEDELEESSAAAQTTTVQPPSTQPNLINVDVTVLTSAQTSRNPDAYFPSSTPSPDQMTATQTRTTVHPTSPPLNIFSTSPSFESRSTRAYNSTSGPDTAPVTQNEPTDVRSTASGSNISSSSTPEQTSTPTIQPSLSSKTPPDPTTQASLPPATVPLFEDELEESSAAAQTTTVQPPSTQPNLINVDVTVLTSAQTSRNPDAYFPSSTPSPDQMTATQTRTTVHPTSPPLNIFSTSPSFESRSTRAYNSTSGPDTAPVTQNEPTDVRPSASGSNISSSSTPGLLLCCATVLSSDSTSPTAKPTTGTPLHKTTISTDGTTSVTKGPSTPSQTKDSATSITSQPATTRQTDGTTHTTKSPKTSPDITQTTDLTVMTNTAGSIATSVAATSIDATSIAATGIATTIAPTSKAPTSIAATSIAPTSKAPTSKAPTSNAPTSIAATSKAPTSNSQTIPQTHNPTSGSTQTNRPYHTTQKISTSSPTIITTKTIHTTTLELDEHKPEGLISGVIAVIICFFIALVLIVMAGLYYYKIRRRSYGPLLDNTTTGIGHFSNPMYDP